MGFNKVTNIRLSKSIIPFLGFTITLLILVYLVFSHFPLLGHDYSLVISWANDYNFAWNKFDVFNLIFTPQRCGGVPVWANPIGSNFSFFHLLSIFFKDLHVIFLFITTILSLSYWGTRKFLSLFNLSSLWTEYFCISWCLQGFIVARLIVGHLPLMNISLWPLYAYLLLKQSNSKSRMIFEVLALMALYTHDFYLGNVYLFVMFPISFLLLMLILKINNFKIDSKTSIIKLITVVIASAILISPKVFAIIEFTKNFQRSVSFIPIEFKNSLNYIFMNYILPLRLEYNQMTGWWYGNWESLNYLFPGLFVFIIIKIVLNFKENSRLIYGLLIIFSIATLIVSGVYGDFVKNIPVIKSFHVNPRWLPILNLSILTTMVLFIEKTKFPKWGPFIFILSSLYLPFLFMDKVYLGINYTYRQGLDVNSNRVNYCYEPVFGFRLELLPLDKIQGKYADPRCYLGDSKCKNYSLPKELYNDLENYKLMPFKN